MSRSPDAICGNGNLDHHDELFSTGSLLEGWTTSSSGSGDFPSASGSPFHLKAWAVGSIRSAHGWTLIVMPVGGSQSPRASPSARLRVAQARQVEREITSFGN
jgi:hypothetical protein